ncbi:MAG TPA: SAM-dependent methyltransferase [Herpetosiphonaceae bacterium]
MNESTYREELAALVADEQTFVRLTLSGAVRDPSVPWKRVVARPVRIKGRAAIQFSFFDERKDITKNFQGAEAAEQIRAALELPFGNITLERTGERIQLRRSKKGKLLVSRERLAAPAAPDLAHNRVKDLPLPVDRPDPFLEKIGIMSPDGQVRPSKQRKFTQINEFLRALDGALGPDAAGDGPLRIVDCGCGSAYLTFAAYHYLNNVRAIPARLIGIDRNSELIAKCARQSHELGYEAMEFQQTPIEDWQPGERPDMLLSLHACDTATDDALALAIRTETRFIFSVPCCHQYLNAKIDADALRPILRYGIMRQRTADILTDTFRAHILRIMGYKAEIFEFVTPDQTSKNLMIRAVRGNQRPAERSALLAEYRRLKEFWGVTPYLEPLLGEPFAALLAADAPA